MINGKKDLTKCMARTKIEALGGGSFWRVYLWEDTESMILQSGIDGECRACHCSMQYYENIITGAKSTHPLMGEIHFIKDKWDVEVVSHECTHAMIHYNNSRNLKDESEYMTVEEQLCYLQGDLCNNVYKWLWQKAVELKNNTIANETQYERALIRAEEIFNAKPDTAEGRELDGLIPLIVDYENKYHPVE